MAENKGYDKLCEALKTGEIEQVYIFYGEEGYLCRTRLEQLRELLIPAGFEEFNHHRLSGKGLSVLALQETVECMPMMAERTLVEVTDLDIFRMDETSRGQFIAMLEDFPEYCTLVLIYDTLPYKRDKKMKKLCSALDAHVSEVEFRRQESKALYHWVRRHFAATGHDIDADTVEHLLFTCGSMMTNLAAEIDKIGAYAKGKVITRQDIDTLADPILDAKVFDMTDRITAGKFNDAAAVLADLLRMQEEPIMILAAIAKELRKLYTARIALDTGKDRYWLKELWNLNSDYPAKLMLQAAKRVDRLWCADAVKKAQILDRRMKSEKKIDSAQELKLFLMELAGTR